MTSHTMSPNPYTILSRKHSIAYRLWSLNNASLNNSYHKLSHTNAPRKNPPYIKFVTKCFNKKSFPVLIILFIVFFVKIMITIKWVKKNYRALERT